MKRWTTKRRRGGRGGRGRWPPRENYTRLPGDNRLVFVSTNVISRVHEVVRAAWSYLESASRPPPSPSPFFASTPRRLSHPRIFLSRVEKLSPRAAQHSLERRFKKKKKKWMDSGCEWSNNQTIRCSRWRTCALKNLIFIRADFWMMMERQLSK